ncbi:hypothetical protein, partial [Klebsiella pneumoniae]|uniref:hypothetical protein n=1 Tax=Klebsiella pneumoniae TaxID=573 RepID=UPI0030138734
TARQAAEPRPTQDSAMRGRKTFRLWVCDARLRSLAAATAAAVLTESGFTNIARRAVRGPRSHADDLRA